MANEEQQFKTPVVVKIPENLVLYLKKVHQGISASDETTTLESDDLIKYEEFDFAYGGLADANVGKFKFTYYTDDENDSAWQIILIASEIEKVATGETKNFNLWTCHNTSCGGMFSSKDDLCSNCD